MKTNHRMVLVTDQEIYRLDEMGATIDRWLEAFRRGKIVLVPNESIDEYEAHLDSMFQEENKLRTSESI